MISVFDLAVLSLASGRTAYSVTTDTIFEPVRAFVFRRSAPHGATFENADGQQIPWRMAKDFVKALDGDWLYNLNGEQLRKPGFWGQLFECFYCVTAWTSAFWLAAYLLAGTWAIWFAMPFCLWALANLYAKVLHS